MEKTLPRDAYVSDGITNHDISPFTADRAILQGANPPRSYMV